jgi:LysR family transcriptional regulator, low CO2-responsive transcriptional regulator
MFETAELQVLVGVANGKTLAEIGEELLLSHPSVSKTLRAAEHKAGLRLVERRGRRLQLTVDGVRVAAAAQETLLKLREMDTILAGVRGGETGALRILASSTICNYVLAPVVGQLLGTSQELDISIQGAENGTDIWATFDKGEYEIAIDRMLPPPHIAASHLFDDQLCLCVAADSELARAPEVHWPSLSNHTLIGPLGADELWGQFSLLGIRPRSRIQVSSVALAKRLVEDGHAVALLYQSVALEEAAAGRIAMLKLPEVPITVSYWMATRGGAPTPLIQRFAAILRAHVRHLLEPSKLVGARTE